MEDTIAQIGTVKINDNENNKKIIVKFNLIEEVLIFEGYCKIKINNINNWQLLTTMVYKMNENTDNINFEKITKDIYDAIIRKIELFDMIKAYMYEVTEVEIKSD
jgi:hypothetical protein